MYDLFFTKYMSRGYLGRTKEVIEFCHILDNILNNLSSISLTVSKIYISLPNNQTRNGSSQLTFKNFVTILRVQIYKDFSYLAHTKIIQDFCNPAQGRFILI